MHHLKYISVVFYILFFSMVKPIQLIKAISIVIYFTRTSIILRQFLKIILSSDLIPVSYHLFIYLDLIIYLR